MDIFDELRKTKKISSRVIQEGTEKFGKLFIRALDFLKKYGPKITKHIFQPSGMIIWTIEGKKDEYLLYPHLFCQCQSFIIGTLYREKKYSPCKHLLAQELADALEKYTIKIHKDNEWKRFRNELIEY